MHGALVPFEDLKAITGYNRLADVERCLQAARIPYFRGRAGIWTTVPLLNSAGGLTPVNQDDAYPAEAAA